MRLTSTGTGTMCAPSEPHVRLCIRPQINPNRYPNESPMGSTPSGSAKPMTGAALPPHLEIDRDGGSRASAGGRI
jgi:hypothetical protein